MVCVCAPDSPFDPALGRINVVLDGDWVRGDQTTLGADNGIGVAAMLAVGEQSFDHGPLELLFTVDEETGLTGAMQLDPGLLSARMLLNLDSEDDRAFYVGAAGGRQIGFRTAGRRLLQPAEAWAGLELDIRDLNGGHSGIDIGKGHLNAIHAIARLLRPAAAGGRIALQLIEGGSQTNVIPSASRAQVLFPPGDEASLRATLDAGIEELREQYREIEQKWTCELRGLPLGPMIDALDPPATERLLDLLLAFPSGVLTMSQAYPGQVETSANLGVLRQEGGEIDIRGAVRSNKAGGIGEAFGKLQALGRIAGVRVEESSVFPPWSANRSSRLLDICKEAYRRAARQEPVAKTVHAGLECSLIGAKLPELDMVSFGPVIDGAHTTSEGVSIASVERFWGVLVAVLTALAK
jgi:dipeptidase D